MVDLLFWRAHSAFTTNSMYSFNSTLTLVLYWYIWPPPIHVGLNLTSTKCKPVVLDICSFQDVADIWGALEFRNAVLKQMTQNTGLTLRITLRKYIYFKLDPNCVILQLLPTKPMLRHITRHCVLCQAEPRPSLGRSRQTSFSQSSWIYEAHILFGF